MKLKLIIPAAILIIGGLSACTAPATTPASSQQEPAAAGQAQGTETGEAAGKPVEEPLTGELKEKAEAAALKEYPGEVKKSEHDAERPGHYAVEIEQESGKHE